MTKPTETAPNNVTLFPGSGQGTLTTPTGEEVPVRTFQRSRLSLPLTVFDNIVIGDYQHLQHGMILPIAPDTWQL